MAALVAACGNDHGTTTDGQSCTLPAFEAGTDGASDPMAAVAGGHAAAGRVKAADLPAVPSGLITWKAGDFVLANDKVAMVIEDVGDSDLYDPWGGRPVGLARVVDGKMVEPNNFGELFLLVGRSTVVTDRVSVLHDGSDGGPAVIRVHGKLDLLPFFQSIIAPVYSDAYTDFDAAIDYTLAPGGEAVTVTMHVASPRTGLTGIPSTLHALMYTKRTPMFQPGLGFDEQLHSDFAALVDDQATSWAYVPSDGPFQTGLAESGFVGSFTDGFDVPACGVGDQERAKIVIGGPGLDGIVAAVARSRGEATRVVTGHVTRGGAVATGVRVHATVTGDGSYLTRATTDASGAFSLTVPMAADVTLTAFERGNVVVTAPAGPGDNVVALPATGTIHVAATDGGVPAPVRVQVVPAGGQDVPSVPAKFGEAQIAAGRLHVAFAGASGAVDLPAPPGSWKVIVSRGYEYELVEKTVTVTAGATVNVDAPLEHSVDTTGTLCGDFHVHTWRSNDSGDDSLLKVSQAIADGLELPVRSDHEFVADFSAEIAQLGLGAWAAAIGSVELTSFEVWGHMGVFPLVPDPTKVNNGAPKWQTFPTAEAPDVQFSTMAPPAVFDTVRARPEAPVVIINHPRGGANYFDYVGFDPATGLASSVSDWDVKFTLVEVFNDSSWTENRGRNVEDWLGLLKSGRKVFAVGSSDSHQLSSSPVGYPRTCIALGTDDVASVTGPIVRDALAAGHAKISGGIFVDTALGEAKPGDTTTGAGSPQTVDVTVQAPTWVDVTTVEVIVDGVTVDTIPVMPGDADPTNPAVRFHKQVPVSVQATGGFVVIAAYGGQALEPVHPGRLPFGVAEPIFVTP